MKKFKSQLTLTALEILKTKSYQIIIIMFLSIFTKASVASAVCYLGDIQYQTGDKIELAGDILECQTDGTWKKI